MEQWYTNKELYEFMVDLSKKFESLSAELGKTQVMIRDYNGLREKINEVDDCIKALQGQQQGNREGSRDMWGYLIGGIGFVVALLSVVIKK